MSADLISNRNMRVNGWLKYLMVFIVAMLFCSNTADEVLQTNPFSETHSSVLIADCNFENPISDSNVVLPRRVLFNNSIRFNQQSQRQQNLHRYHVDISKQGKTKNDGICHSVQHKSILIHSYIIKAVHKLISFGKLII